MEQEVYVPMPADTVRRALADADRVARSIPGLALDAGEAPDEGALTGRLRLRVAGSTITYRGSFRLTPHEDGLAVEGEGTEARGSGSVKIALTLTPRPADGSGTALVCAGTVSSEGRLASVSPAQARSAGTRLLERFAESLAAGLETDPLEAAGPAAGAAGAAEGGLSDDNEPVIPGIPAPEVPPPALDPLSDDELEFDEVEEVEEDVEVEVEDEPEAAHARRTMIGRSAEEVDHAPPRGRYAPMPAPDTVAPAGGFRWVAPAAALAVATAVVVGRALRRRRV